MDIIQLKYFIAVAESGSFSEAAEIMFSAQSTVSKQIAALEKELNVLLFDRSKRRISLTEHGSFFLNHAQLILDNYNDMLRELESITAVDDNSASIRATAAMLPYNLLGYISDFKNTEPWANIMVEEFDGEDIMQMLKDSECDLAFFRVGKFDEEHYEKLPVLIEKYIAVLPINHPLADKKSISLSQLSNEKFILGRHNSCLHRTAINACTDVGFEPNVIATSNHTTNIFEMVGMNMGVSLLLHKGTEHYMNDAFSKSIRLVPLDETFTVEEGTQMEMKDLINLLKTYIGEFEDVCVGKMDIEFKEKFHDLAKDIRAQIDALYGEEYAEKMALLRKLEVLEDKYEFEFEKLDDKEEVLTENMKEEITLLIGENQIETLENLEDYIEIIEEEIEEIRENTNITELQEQLKHTIEEQLNQLKKGLVNTLKPKMEEVHNEFREIKKDLKERYGRD